MPSGWALKGSDGGEPVYVFGPKEEVMRVYGILNKVTPLLAALVYEGKYGSVVYFKDVQPVYVNELEPCKQDYGAGVDSAVEALSIAIDEANRARCALWDVDEAGDGESVQSVVDEVETCSRKAAENIGAALSAIDEVKRLL